MDAVQIVADKAGIALQYQARLAQPASVNPNQELYEIHQEASKFYQAILMTTKMGKKRDTICMNVV